MNAYDHLDSMKRLERRHAQAVAGEINDSSADNVGGIAAMIAVATAVLGVLISIK